MAEGPTTVLIVDDDENNRRICSAFLGHMGYRVLEAADGVSAIAISRAERPQVVLLDIVLPVMDGYEIARRLKMDPATAHIPIIAFTADVLDGALNRAREAGADWFLAKPVELRHIATAVMRALDASLG